MAYTYNLIEARISMEAGKIKKNNNKKRKKRKNQVVSFRKLLLYVYFSFVSRLGKSSKFVVAFFLFCFWFLFLCSL